MSANPIDLEIGCGVGMHAIRYARENPHRNVIAIERTHEKFAKFKSRVTSHRKTHQLRNLFPVHDEASSWVSHLPQNIKFENIFLLYPNPYPKPSQKNKRWYAMPFMNELVKRLQTGGHIHLATNEYFYHEGALEEMYDNFRLECVATETLGKEQIPHARTHFEKKYLERGQKCYNSIYQLI